MYAIRSYYVDYNLPAVTQLNTPWQIEFNKVNFKYQNNQERNILDQLSFTLQSGQFVGIVGRNGSGKTTLIKVLSKIYDHYEGSITINQQELHTVPAGYFRKKVAVVPQEVYLFDGTIKENIAYAKPGAVITSYSIHYTKLYEPTKDRVPSG